MKKWVKYKGSVKGGIEVVRMKLMSSLGVPHFFVLADDLGCESLAEHMEKYHFVTDAAGQVSEIPDDEDDDVLDALRYLVMNVFAPKGKLNLSIGSKNSILEETTKKYDDNSDNNWMANKIAELTEGETSMSNENITIKKGRFVLDI